VKLLEALFYSQGFILPLIRLLEPGSFNLNKLLFRKLFSCRKKLEMEEEEVEPIRMLLDSTLNIEFVYVILEGIVKFSKMTFAIDTSLEEEQLVFVERGRDVELEMK